MGGRRRVGHHVPMEHRSAEELEAGLADIRRAPADAGVLELIVRRPEIGEREVLDAAELSRHDGLVGDNWRTKGSRHTDDGAAEPNRQLTIMSARAIDLFAGGDRSRWPEAGDQLYVDIDLSAANLPPGTRLGIGAAVVEVSVEPHTGCAKFRARFGPAASKLVNTEPGRELNLRGINARVIEEGAIKQGDKVHRLAPA
jgi:MOSC domain-containing protein YiiM